MNFSYRDIQKHIVVIMVLALLLLDFTYLFWDLERNIKLSAQSRNEIKFVLNTESDAIHFSHEAGFYRDYFDLTLHTESGYIIRYTTDTRTPTWESAEYTGPISLYDIAKTSGKKSSDGTIGVVIRAGLFDGQDLVGEIYSNTYVFGSTIEERHSLPVVFLVSDYENLFGSQGIYTKYNNRGIQYEKPVHFDFVGTDGSILLSQNAGIRIFGAAMRGLPLKSFRLTARNEYEYGKNRFYYEFFPGLTSKVTGNAINSFKHLVLRNSGNDYNSTMFRDALMQRISAGTGLDIQQYRPVAVYVNGEYWGIMNLREFLNNDYIESHYGLDSDKITIISNNAYDGGPRFGETDYLKLMSYVRRYDMSNPEYYENVKKMMDIDNYLRYCAVQVYLANGDWLLNNIRSWKYNTFDGEYDEYAQYGADGRFRWLLKDTDFGFGLMNSYSHNTLGMLISNSSLFRNLMKNEDFARDYINYTCDFLNDIFIPEKVIDEINNVQLGIAAEIPYHIERWRDSAGGSVAGWNNNVNVMRRFADARPNYVLRYLKRHFSLNDEVRLSVGKSEGGYVIVNSIDLSKTESFAEGDSWQGIYFPDIPVRITAVAYPGYEFSGWEKSSDNAGFLDDTASPSNRVVLQGDAEIYAVFRKTDPNAETPSTEHPAEEYPYVITESAKNRVLLDGEFLDKDIKPLIHEGTVYLCIDEMKSLKKFRNFRTEDYITIDGKKYAPAEKFAKYSNAQFYWSEIYQSVIISK